jgi:SulP family sulfate permease
MSQTIHAGPLIPPAPKEPALQRLLPISAWLPGYHRAWLTGDVVAGLTIWGLLVPEALAYAGIAGVPPQYGLYCAPLALLAYAVFGGSRHLIVGPSSTVAIVSASVVAPLAASGSDARYLALTIALALLTGAVLVVAGLARLGFVAKFLAKPVLDGFIIGLAFTIAIGQAGKLLGVHASGDTAVDKAVGIFGQIGDWSWLPFVVGGSCLALMFLMSRYVPKIPGALVALVLATLAAYAFDLGQSGLELVGDITGGLPDWALKGLGWEDIYSLLPGACAVALVGFTESIAIAKEDATRNDYEVDANREMVANGLANIGSGLFQGFAVDGSLSKTAAGEGAGGRTQIAGLVCAVLTLVTILFLTGLFAYLPEAALGAIVIHALWKYFDLHGLVRLYRLRRADFLLSVSALLGVCLFGVLAGVALGVVLSLVLLIQRASSPNSAVLGRQPGGDEFADLANHPDYETIPGLVIYRFDAPLVFPNAERFVHEIRALARAGPSTAGAQPVRAVIIDLEVTADMDTTAADQFADLVTALHRIGVRLMLARVHARVQRFMTKDGLTDQIGEDNFFPRVLDAVRSYQDGPTA